MPTKYKLIIWHALIVLLALVFWTYTAGVIDQPSDSFELGWESIVYLVAFASVIALGFALFQNKWLALSITAAIGVPYLLALPGYFSLAGIVAMVLLLLYSRSATATELRERSKVNIRAILRRSLTGVMLALFIAVSFAAFGSPIAEELERSERLPPGTKKFIESIVKGTIGPRIEGSQQQKEAVTAEVTQETFHELNTFLQPYFKFAPSLLAIVVFLILWGFSWPFIQLSVLLGMVIFRVLKRTGFVKIETKDVKAEVLVV